MNKIGVIYIGANSVKFTLMDIMKTGYYKIIYESSSNIKLTHDLIDSTEISEHKINETLSNVRAFKSLCKVSDVNDIIAVATCALNKATNCDYFLRLIKENFDIDVTLLSDEDEIYCTYLGVTKSIYTNNSLIVDICGSCTHITWINDGKIQESATIPFGSLNHTYKYHLEDRVLCDNLESSISVVQDALDKIEWLRKGNYDSVIGVGGTIRAICKIDRAKKRYPFDILHNYRLSDYDVHQIYNNLKCKDYKQRVKVEGLSSQRADLIVGGLTIFDTLLENVNCENIIVSGRGLREGIIISYIESNYGPIKDILDYNLNGIIDYLNINRKHAEDVFNMTSMLYNNLKSLHKLGTSYDNVLKTATLLHDSGISIDYYHHYKHSFYVILHSNINGLSHRELIVSAAIASVHNNKNGIPLQAFFSVINKIDLKAVDFIGLLLSIAESLYKSLENAIETITVDIQEDCVLIQLASNVNITFEIEQALTHKEKFKNIYGKELKIQQI